MRLEYKGWMTPAIVGVTSFVAGIGTGLFIQRYRYLKQIDGLETQFVETKDQVEEVASDLNQMQFQFDENLERMNSVIQQANRVIVNFMDSVTTSVNEVITTSDIQHTSENEVEDNVYQEVEEDGWSYEEELKNRGPDRPYIIHRDEFFSDEMDLSQSSLTYYNGDNILCDEKDVPIYNPEKVVGVLEFGKGSHDPNVVYVRNERLMAEYEILLEPGFFQTEVLGHEIEDHIKGDNLKHSLLKFRDTD